MEFVETEGAQLDIQVSSAMWLNLWTRHISKIKETFWCNLLLANPIALKQFIISSSIKSFSWKIKNKHWPPDLNTLQLFKNYQKELTTCYIFSQLFLDKVESIQQKQKQKKRNETWSTISSKKFWYTAVCTTSYPGHLNF